MAGRNAKRGWWCLFRDWRSQVHPKVKLLFCSSTKNCYVHCSMTYDVWNDSNGALCSTQSVLPMGTWQKYPRFSPLSFKVSSSVASLARTLCHSALKNASLCFSNHRVPTGRDMGAIRTAHISASSNAACWLLISLQQMVWQKVQEIQWWTVLIGNVCFQLLHLVCLYSETQGFTAERNWKILNFCLTYADYT